MKKKPELPQSNSLTNRVEILEKQVLRLNAHFDSELERRLDILLKLKARIDKIDNLNSLDA